MITLTWHPNLKVYSVALTQGLPLNPFSPCDAGGKNL